MHGWAVFHDGRCLELAPTTEFWCTFVPVYYCRSSCTQPLTPISLLPPPPLSRRAFADEIFEADLSEVFPDADLPSKAYSMKQSPDGSMYWIAGIRGVIKKVQPFPTAATNATAANTLALFEGSNRLKLAKTFYEKISVYVSFRECSGTPFRDGA